MWRTPAAVVVPETGGSGGIWPVASNSRCLKRERPQTFCNSLAKIDAESSELLLLAQPTGFGFHAYILGSVFSGSIKNKHMPLILHDLLKLP